MGNIEKGLRKYGRAPFNIAVIHGGPGAPGEMAPVAKELAKTHGVLEPLQTQATIDGQLQELKSILLEHGTIPLTLIGYSWGAWLSFIFAALHPTMVKKLIMISSGPFEASYATDIMKTRLSRLTEEERYDVEALKDKNNSWAQLTKYLPKMDSYCPLPHHNDVIDFQFNIYESVWPEAAALRKSGKLLELGKHIQCPVVAIHGDYDPHPAEGVQKPLAATLKNFHFILIPQCGHKPWIEKMAQEKFYKILEKEVDSI